MAGREDLHWPQAAIHQRAARPAHLKPSRLRFHDPIGLRRRWEGLQFRHAEPLRHTEEREFRGWLRGDHLDLLEIGFA
jgi:hypothetical protein